MELWLIGTPMDDAREILRRNAGLYTHQGVQPRSRLSRFYSQGSVLVLPSVEEGLAYVQAQAMACGIPVIATPNTGAEDLFTNNVEGFIVPIRDPGAIRERIQLLLDNRDTHRKMSEAALRRVQGIGGWDSYGDRSLSICTAGSARFAGLLTSSLVHEDSLRRTRLSRLQRHLLA